MNQPNTIIHIGTVHLHSPPPSVAVVEGYATAAALHEATGLPVSVALDSPKGTVTDLRTGLMWSKATIAKDKTWADAKTAAEAVRLGGYTDWRLPTRAELLTLVDDTRSDPAIDTTRFECESAWYWTSTPLASSPSDFAWVVDFNDGDASYLHQYDDGRVRAVRSVSSAPGGQ